ncbi:hypothetical protein Tco_0680748 [Tanacetum coccineum]|uniref:Uncharacterized protein n=1 Tax=Tanacetum coccineum TaxID=301880 RepID=A0ABQ4XLD1_9ASTR
MDDEFLAIAYPKVHENLKLTTDERVIEENPESHSGSMSSMKNLEDTDNFGDQFLYDKPTEDDQEKSKVVDESDSTIPDPSHQTVTSTPPVIAPFTDVSSTKPSLLVTPPPINTEATTITTSLPEITPFIALQLRVARLEQEMSEVKKTDHSADVLASIESQVPTAVDKYLGTKLDNALLKPETILIKNLKRVRRRLSEPKREQVEEKQDSTYSIRSTDKVDLEEFDLKNHKRKHDSDDVKTMMKLKALHLEQTHGRETSYTQNQKYPFPECIPKRNQRKNWQDTYATTYQVPTENKLQRKTYDIGSFIKWFCRRTGKKKLCKADLEDVDSEHFDRDDNTGDDNEETKPDPEEIYNSGPAPSLMTPGYISSGIVQILVSPTPYVPPSKKDYESYQVAIVASRAVDPVGSPSSTTIDQDEQSTSTSPTNQEIQSQVTHQGVEE